MWFPVAQKHKTYYCFPHYESFEYLENIIKTIDSQKEYYSAVSEVKL